MPIAIIQLARKRWCVVRTVVDAFRQGQPFVADILGEVRESLRVVRVERLERSRQGARYVGKQKGVNDHLAPWIRRRRGSSLVCKLQMYKYARSPTHTRRNVATKLVVSAAC